VDRVLGLEPRKADRLLHDELRLARDDARLVRLVEREAEDGEEGVLRPHVDVDQDPDVDGGEGEPVRRSFRWHGRGGRSHRSPEIDPTGGRRHTHARQRPEVRYKPSANSASALMPSAMLAYSVQPPRTAPSILTPIADPASLARAKERANTSPAKYTGRSATKPYKTVRASPPPRARYGASAKLAIRLTTSAA